VSRDESPSFRHASTSKLLALLAVTVIIASASFTLGKFSARDTITRPEMSWALGSTSSIKISDLSISLEHAAQSIRASKSGASEAALDVAYEYLSELLSASVEMYIAKGDPRRPEFTDWMSGYRKFLGDSPDAIYSTAPVDASMEYEIGITTGSADYIGLVVYERNPLTGWNRVADKLSVFPEKDSSPLQIRLSSGSFTPPRESRIDSSLDAQPERPSLYLSHSSHMVMIREYFFDSQIRTPSTLSIRALNTAGHDHNKLAFQTRAEGAVNFFNQTWQGSLALADAMRATTNSFDRPAAVSPDFVGIFYPTPDNAYHGGAFALENDEALIVEGTIPDAAFWSITLQNQWMQSIETSEGAASLTGRQITNRKGQFRVWISHLAPPQGEDWLNTGGETEGLVAIRYLLAETAVAPSARVQKLDDN